MPHLPPGWTADDVTRELLDAPPRAFAAVPGLEVIDRPDWMQLTCVHFPRGGLNEVSRSRLSEQNADMTIDATIAHYATRGLTFRWSVTPDATPSDLAARLERRGLRSKPVVAMARSTSMEARALDDIEVLRVGPESIDLLADVMCEGWGAPVGAMGDYHRACLRDPRFAFFIARVNGVAVGGGGAVFFERSVYLLGGVVLPAFRRRGVYRALTTARLTAGRELGLLLATTRATADTSAPLLTEQGWDAWFTFPSFSTR